MALKFGYNNLYWIIAFLPSFHLDKVQVATTKVIKGLTHSRKAQKPNVDRTYKTGVKKIILTQKQDNGWQS